MKRNFLISIWMTLATTVLLGILYPLVVTLLAQWAFPRQANGEIIHVGGKMVGSSLIGQPFTSAGYFHSRPSAAGRLDTIRMRLVAEDQIWGRRIRL